MNVYEIITEQIIKQLEQGVAPWRKPWTTDVPCNLSTGKEYRGVNVFLLAMQNRPSKYWLTFKQASAMNGHIRAGEKASTITFWNVGARKLNTETGKYSQSFVLRYYSVFNVSQIDGLESLGLGNSTPVPNIDACDAIVASMPNPPKREDSDHAFYRPSTDSVGMPLRSSFVSSQEFYSVLFHELIHSTGHASRVNRERMPNQNFGTDSYSREELIAELGSSMLCAVTGIAPSTVQNSAAYLQSWINVLKGDSKLILSASSAAQKACDYIRAIKPCSETEVQS